MNTKHNHSPRYRNKSRPQYAKQAGPKNITASNAAKNSGKVNYRAGANGHRPLVIPKSKFEKPNQATYRIFWNRQAFKAHKAGRRLRNSRRQNTSFHQNRGARAAGRIFNK